MALADFSKMDENSVTRISPKSIKKEKAGEFPKIASVFFTISKHSIQAMPNLILVSTHRTFSIL